MIEFVKKIAPYQNIFLGAIVLLVLALMIELFYIWLQYDKKKKETKALSAKDYETIMGADYTGRSIFERDDAMQRIVAPDGIDPNADPSMFILNDSGVNIYERVFTLTALSDKKVEFAKTFAPLLNFSSATSSIKIRPITNEEMQRLVNKHITTLTVEYGRSEDVNRTRQLRHQLEAENTIADKLETGNSNYYNVELGIAIRANSLAKLSSMTDDLLATARKIKFNLAGCFAVQPEAFFTIGPLNKDFARETNFGILSDFLPKTRVKSSSMESFLMDQKACSTFFNYIQNDFNQKEGVFLGWNKPSNTILNWDPFLATNGYNTIFAGQSGSGKSVTQKVMIARMAHNTSFVAIDSQRAAGMEKGEYSLLAEGLNGVVYRISNEAGSDKMNIFEISTSTKAVTNEFGKVIGEEPVLELNDLKVAISANLMLIITSNSATKGATRDINTAINISDKVSTIVSQLFEEKKIYNGKPDSLYIPGYESLAMEDRPVKELPTLTRFFEIAAYRSAISTDEEDRKTYKLIMSAVKEYVTFCAYNTVTGSIYTEEELNEMPTKVDGTHYVVGTDGVAQDVICIRGSRLYYDGQSTVRNGKARFTNIDISGLPESEVGLARSIAVHLVNQKYISKNSENPEKAERLVVIYDEAHYLLNDPYSAQIVSAQARTVRKKHVSMWISLQQLTDAQNNGDAKIVLDNTAQIFLFKHRGSSKAFVQEITGMSDSQFAYLCDLGGDLLSTDNSRKGECCLCIGKHSYFLKVAYIKETEGRFAETDARERVKIYNQLTQYN